MNITYKEPKANDHSFYAFRKKWESIAQCYEHYGIKYRNVMQYKSNNKCNTEAALQKYINYKKNIFFTFVGRSGLQWSDLQQLCRLLPCLFS